MQKRAVLAGLALAASGLAMTMPTAAADVDTGFANGGRYILETTGRLVTVAKPGGSGNIYVIGTELGSGANGLLHTVLRIDELTAGGLRVASFGNDGIVRIDLSPLDGFDDAPEPNGVAVLPDGRLAIQLPVTTLDGVTRVLAGNLIVVVIANGSPDPTFDGDGFRVDLHRDCGYVTDLVYSASDQTLVSLANELTGQLGSPPAPNPCRGSMLRKYRLNGSTVTTFGNQSVAGGHHDSRLYATDLHIDADGVLYAAGVVEGNHVGVLKLTASGANASYGTDGIATFEPSTVPFEYYGSQPGFHRTAENKAAFSVSVDSTGRAVVTGASRPGAPGSIDRLGGPLRRRRCGPRPRLRRRCGVARPVERRGRLWHERRA